MNVLITFRDAAYAVANLRSVKTKMLAEPVLDTVYRLAQRLDALLPLAPRPELGPVEVRGFTALAQERVGGFIMATDAHPHLEPDEFTPEVQECLIVARNARKSLESFALRSAPVTEMVALGLFFEMLLPSGAAELLRFTPAMIRALEAARDAGVKGEDLSDFRAGHDLTVRMVEVMTTARVEGIPLEYAAELV